jgi:hypothetical protein
VAQDIAARDAKGNRALRFASMITGRKQQPLIKPHVQPNNIKQPDRLGAPESLA